MGRGEIEKGGGGGGEREKRWDREARTGGVGWI